jgi:hypothetical protein
VGAVAEVDVYIRTASGDRALATITGISGRRLSREHGGKIQVVTAE